MPKRKQPNGMGSIRKRSDGRWEGRYTALDNVQRSVYARTKDECAKKLREKLAEVDGGIWIEPSVMTVRQWLDRWLRDYTSGVDENTLHTYQQSVNRISEYIGEIPLTKLNSLHVRSLVSALEQKGYAPNTISLNRTVLSTALGVAVDGKLIRENPCRGVKVRKRETEMHIVDRPHFAAFIQETNQTKYALPLQFLLYTGLRIGELRGLTWEQVDFAKREIRIDRQLSRSLRVSLPKYAKTRTVKLTPGAVAILERQRIALKEQRMALGHDFPVVGGVQDLVFRSATGGEVKETVLNVELKRIGESIGVSGLHLHDLRHSYAVASLRAGVDVKTLQQSLGHASAAMTLDVYAAYTDDAAKVANDRLSAYFAVD